jgi:hypothetical protein
VLIPRRDHRRQLAMVPALYLGGVHLCLVLVQLALSAGCIFYQVRFGGRPG